MKKLYNPTVIIERLEKLHAEAEQTLNQLEGFAMAENFDLNDPAPGRATSWSIVWGTLRLADFNIQAALTVARETGRLALLKDIKDLGK